MFLFITKAGNLGVIDGGVVRDIIRFCDGCGDIDCLGLRFQRRKRPVKEQVRTKHCAGAEEHAEQQREESAPQLGKADHAGQRGQHACAKQKNAERALTAAQINAAEACDEKNSIGGE